MTGMSELDTESPVVWPSWCYSGDRLGMTTVEGGGVKSERLSPGAGAGGESSSSRSGTPSSSYPGTPPTTSPTQPTPRNYSDFMRTLAAKYNNNHPNDYFSGRNGISKGLSGGKEESEVKDTPNPAMLGFVPFLPPMVEATQALLTMVRQGANPHLEGYLKAVKRGSEPLDLTTSAPVPKTAIVPPKRPKKTSLSESLYGSDMIPLLRQQSRKPLSPKPRKSVSSNKPCTSACPPCTPDSQVVSLWSVEDVASFVSTVDMCAEYASNFREQKIDGSSLGLLTEEHLTGSLGMKLGPALKLKTVLAAKLGQCVICQHCVHCHQPPDK